jgi:hypothetical protein
MGYVSGDIHARVCYLYARVWSFAMKIQWDHERIRRLIVRALADGRFGGLWEIALLAGMSPSFLSRIMHGERGMRLWKAESLAAVLGVEVRDLMLSNGHTSTSFPASDDSDGKGDEINFANDDPRVAATRGSLCQEGGSHTAIVLPMRAVSAASSGTSAEAIVRPFAVFVVGRVGLEPTARGLKVRCSAS